MGDYFDEVRFVEKEGFELWLKDRKLSGDALDRAEETARAADVTIVALINPWEMPVFDLVRRAGKRVGGLRGAWRTSGAPASRSGEASAVFSALRPAQRV